MGYFKGPWGYLQRTNSLIHQRAEMRICAYIPLIHQPLLEVGMEHIRRAHHQRVAYISKWGCALQLDGAASVSGRASLQTVSEVCAVDVCACAVDVCACAVDVCACAVDACACAVDACVFVYVCLCLYAGMHAYTCVPSVSWHACLHMCLCLHIYTYMYLTYITLELIMISRPINI